MPYRSQVITINAGWIDRSLRLARRSIALAKDQISR